MANIIVSGHSQSFVNGTYIDQGDGTWEKVVPIEDDLSGLLRIFFATGPQDWRIESTQGVYATAAGVSDSDPVTLSWSNNVTMAYEPPYSVTITSQPASVTVVPGQDTTFSVTATANFSPVTFNYRWSNNATTQSIFVDPLMSDNGNTYSVSVSALSSGVVMATTASNTATLTVQEDVPPFDKYDVGPETGRERHRRLRHLGYV